MKSQQILPPILNLTGPSTHLAKDDLCGLYVRSSVRSKAQCRCTPLTIGYESMTGIEVPYRGVRCARASTLASKLRLFALRKFQMAGSLRVIRISAVVEARKGENFRL